MAHWKVFGPIYPLGCQRKRMVGNNIFYNSYPFLRVTPPIIGLSGYPKIKLKWPVFLSLEGVVLLAVF